MRARRHNIRSMSLAALAGFLLPTGDCAAAAAAAGAGANRSLSDAAGDTGVEPAVAAAAAAAAGAPKSKSSRLTPPLDAGASAVEAVVADDGQRAGVERRRESARL